MPRIPLPSAEEMTPQQRRVYDQVIAGPRGQVVGPLRAVIHSPELAERWSRMGEYLRYSTCLPRKLNELAILITGRRWNAQIEFHVHAEAARAAGLKPAAIEAIRAGQPPVFAEEAEHETYEFAREIQQTGRVTETTYRAVERRWGARGVVELTALIGYYTMVSMTLNAHEIPLPRGVPTPLAAVGDGGLTPLPPARRASEAAQ
jgi:4-carboxymuconolactone decarboxylase